MIRRKHFRYLKYVEDGKRQIEDCLDQQPEYNNTPESDRILTSEMHTWKDMKSQKEMFTYRHFCLESSVESYIDHVLSLPLKKRHGNIVFTENHKVRFYMDLEFQPRLDSDTDVFIPTLLEAAVRYICKIFHRVYPSVPSLHTDQFWLFSACTEKKVSFHVHGSVNHENVYWQSLMELQRFMLEHVKPALEKDYMDSDAQLLFRGGEKKNCFIDFSVYHKTQNVKLPTCCKPGKANMMLYRSPDTVNAISSERMQIEVGMICVFQYQLQQYGSLTTELPTLSPTSLESSLLGKRKHTTTSHQGPRIRCEQNVELNKALKEVVSLCFVSGSEKTVSFDSVSRHDGRYVNGTFASGSAVVCKRKQRPHTRDRMKFTGVWRSPKKAEFIVDCFSEACRGYQHAVMTSDMILIQCIFPDMKQKNVEEEEESKEENKIEIKEEEENKIEKEEEKESKIEESKEEKEQEEIEEVTPEPSYVQLLPVPARGFLTHAEKQLQEATEYDEAFQLLVVYTAVKGNEDVYYFFRDDVRQNKTEWCFLHLYTASHPNIPGSKSKFTPLGYYSLDELFTTITKQQQQQQQQHVILPSNLFRKNNIRPLPASYFASKKKKTKVS